MTEFLILSYKARPNYIQLQYFFFKFIDIMLQILKDIPKERYLILTLAKESWSGWTS